jgi:hypothetical protein
LDSETSTSNFSSSKIHWHLRGRDVPVEKIEKLNKLEKRDIYLGL